MEFSAKILFINKYILYGCFILSIACGVYGNISENPDISLFLTALSITGSAALAIVYLLWPIAAIKFLARRYDNIALNRKKTAITFCIYIGAASAVSIGAAEAGVLTFLAAIATILAWYMTIKWAARAIVEAELNRRAEKYEVDNLVNIIAMPFGMIAAQSRLRILQDM